MDRERINFEEHCIHNEDQEKKFVESLIVAFPLQVYEGGDWKLKMIIKDMKRPDVNIYDKVLDRK